MGLENLASPPGVRKNRKRIGRGHGSGSVKTAGRGTKGQKARTGGNINPRFEGGQIPIVKRLPYRRGFTNIFKTKIQVVNLSQLAHFEAGSVVSTAELVQAGIIKRVDQLVKVLVNGDLAGKALTIGANAFSAEAKRKIETAGGQAEVVAG